MFAVVNNSMVKGTEAPYSPQREDPRGHPRRLDDGPREDPRGSPRRLDDGPREDPRGSPRRLDDGPREDPRGSPRKLDDDPRGSPRRVKEDPWKCIKRDSERRHVNSKASEVCGGLSTLYNLQYSIIFNN